MDKSNNRKKSLIKILKLTFVLFAVLIITSCPEPLTDNLLAEVEDLVGPVISVTSPDFSVQYFYPSDITISGMLADYSDSGRTIEGSVDSVAVVDLNYKGISLTPDNTVLPADTHFYTNPDGSFEIFIDTLSGFISGDFTLQITAVDWNGNSTELELDLFDDVTGPNIGINDHSAADYNVYSSALVGSALTISGIVELPTFTFDYEVEEGGSPSIPERDIKPLIDGFGNFSFPFDPFAEGVSGTLKFIFRADDGLESVIWFYLTDDPDAPDDSSSSLATDNTSISLTLDEAVYSATGGIGALDINDFILDFGATGEATDAVLLGLQAAASPGDTSFQVNIGVTGVPDGNETVTLRAETNSIYDRVGNPSTFTTGTINLIDKKVPTVALDGVDQTLAAPIQVEIDFSEDMNTTDAVDVSFYSNDSNNPTAAVMVDSDTVRLTFASLNTGFGLDFSGTSIRDLAGNYLSSMNRAIADGIAPPDPTVTINDGDGYINGTENSAVSFTITGEANSTYNISTATNCTVVPATGTIPGTGITTGLTFTAGIDGAVVLGVELTDASLNTSGEGNDSSIADLAVNAPTVTIDDDGDVTDIYINIAESAAGVPFTINGEDGSTYVITPTNCTLSSSGGIIPIGGGANGNSTGLTLTASGSGAVSISVVLTDLRSNVSTAGVGISTADLSAPTLFSFTDNVVATITDGSEFNFILTFSEPVWDFTGADVVSVGDQDIVGGNKSDFDGDPGDTVYTVSVIPDSGLDGTDTAAGKVTVNINIDDATDKAGNTGPSSSASSYQRVDTENPTMETDTLLTPNGAEDWNYDTSQNITWTSGDITDNYLLASPISLHYRINGSSWIQIAINEANDGTYSWAIPDTVNSNLVEVQITATDTYGNKSTDISAADFTIDSPPSMQIDTLTSPNGLESWTKQTAHNITWVDVDIVDTLNPIESSSITLEYTTDGLTWNPIVTGTNDDGAYNWTLPDIVSSSVKVRITAADADGNTSSDTSDVNFSIVVP
jgi:hypothetical protein